MSAIRDFQVGLVQVLKFDGNLAPLINDVYDMRAPQGATVTPPYIVLDSWTGVPVDRMNGFGVRVTCALHIWTDYQGTKQGGVIESIVEDIVHQGHNRIVLPADSQWSLITLHRSEANYMMDGSLCHGTMRLTAVLHKQPKL